jgi:hypothetical protein
MASYGEELRNRAVAKLLLQESAGMRAMVKEVGARRGLSFIRTRLTIEMFCEFEYTAAVGRFNVLLFWF